VTSAPATLAPVESVTSPVTREFWTDWAQDAVLEHKTSAKIKSMKTNKDVHFLIFGPSPDFVAKLANFHP
jgi:hypothetical protein